MNEADYIVMEYPGISREDLQRHVRFCCKALAAEKLAYIALPNNSAYFALKKRKFKRTPHCLELQIRCLGSVIEGEIVPKIFSVLEEKGFEYTCQYTKGLKTLSRITTSHTIDNVFTPKIMTDIIVNIQEVMNVASDNFTITYWAGSFEDGCSISHDDPVKFPPSFKVGRATGRFVVTVIGLFKGLIRSR
jgi:hypothetical protein